MHCSLSVLCTQSNTSLVFKWCKWYKSKNYPKTCCRWKIDDSRHWNLTCIVFAVSRLILRSSSTVFWNASVSFYVPCAWNIIWLMNIIFSLTECSLTQKLSDDKKTETVEIPYNFCFCTFLLLYFPFLNGLHRRVELLNLFIICALVMNKFMLVIKRSQWILTVDERNICIWTRLRIVIVAGEVGTLACYFYSGWPKERI